MQVTQIPILITGIICITLFVWTLKNRTIIQDESTATVKPYSLSRTVLFFWTFIAILSVHVQLWLYPETAPTVTKTMLTLMGIAMTTTGTARTIDYVQTSVVKRHQDESSEGFLTDLLSDENGISIHRFQHLLFTFIYGTYTIIKIFNCEGKIPDFTDNFPLVLMGFSSGAYALIKIPENGIPKEQHVTEQKAQQSQSPLEEK